MALIRTKKRLSHRCLTIKKAIIELFTHSWRCSIIAFFIVTSLFARNHFFHVVTCHGKTGSRINVPQSGQLCCNGVATYKMLFDLHLSPITSHLSSLISQLSTFNSQLSTFNWKKEWVVQFAVCLAINNMMCALDFFSFGHL